MSKVNVGGVMLYTEDSGRVLRVEFASSGRAAFGKDSATVLVSELTKLVSGMVSVSAAKPYTAGVIEDGPLKVRRRPRMVAS